MDINLLQKTLRLYSDIVVSQKIRQTLLQLVDATYGRRTRAVVVTDSGHIILSAVQPETVANRLVAQTADTEEEE